MQGGRIIVSHRSDPVKGVRGKPRRGALTPGGRTRRARATVYREVRRELGVERIADLNTRTIKLADGTVVNERTVLDNYLRMRASGTVDISAHGPLAQYLDMIGRRPISDTEVGKSG